MTIEGQIQPALSGGWVLVVTITNHDSQWVSGPAPLDSTDIEHARRHADAQLKALVRALAPPQATIRVDQRTHSVTIH
jgi:hypothetical protein